MALVTAELIRNYTPGDPAIWILANDPASKTPFAHHVAWAADPANREIVSRIRHLIIRGDEPTEYGGHRESCLNWPTFWSIVQHMISLEEITMYDLSWDTWIRGRRRGEQEAHVRDLLPARLPALHRFTMERTSFTIMTWDDWHPDRKPAVELPQIVAAESLKELHIRSARFSPWGQSIHVSPWRVPKICLYAPDYHVMRLLLQTARATHLELWDVKDNDVGPALDSIVVNNMQTLEVILLDLSLGATNSSMPWMHTTLRSCKRLRTVILSLRGLGDHPSSHEDWDPSDFNTEVLFPNNIYRTLVSWFRDLPNTVRSVRVILPSAKTDVGCLLRHIGRMPWLELGAALRKIRSLQEITIHVVGVESRAVWDSPEFGKELWVRDALIEGAKTQEEHMAGSHSALPKFEDIPQHYLASLTIPIPFTF